MKIAVVHEWLSSYAGSERVVEQILAVYPEADLFAVVDFLEGRDRKWLGDRAVKTSFIQALPLARRLFRGYLPLMPLAVEQLDLRGYDLVLSSSHAVAKGVLTRGDQLHISYVHTPMRYAWDMAHDYLAPRSAAGRVAAIPARCLMHYLRLWDAGSSRRVDGFLANSKFVARRIRKVYGRRSEVVYPPVDVDAFPLHREKEDFYLAASRLVPYKRVDLVVEAFNRMPGRRLVVIGGGKDEARLRSIAGPNVSVLGHQPFDVLRDHMQRAKAFVFAAQEDFGIAVVEAQACGTPVVCLGKGGATESVVGGETGLFFDEQSADSIVDAVARFESRPGEFDPASIRKNAERFGKDRFREAYSEVVDRAWIDFEFGGVPGRRKARRRLSPATGV